MQYGCKEIKELLPLYLDNMTNQIESTTIEKHLSGCAECHREFEFLKSIVSTASAFPEIELSENFNDTLHEKLVAEKNKKRSLLFSQIRKISVAVLSSVAVITVSVVSLNIFSNKDINENIYSDITAKTPAIIQEETGSQNTADANIEESLAESKETSQAESSEQTAETVSDTASKQDSTAKADSAENDTSSAKEQTEKATINQGQDTSQNKESAAKDNSAKKETAQQESKKESQAETPAARLASVPAENEPALASSAAFTAVEEGQPTDSSDLKNSGASKGGSSGGSSSATTVPSKVKVTANVSVKSSDDDLAKQILSQYDYSDGAYELSQAEYQEVLGQLDAMGASITLTSEDKTEEYANLTDRLEDTGSSTTEIQNELNQIDDEVSKKYIILD